MGKGGTVFSAVIFTFLLVVFILLSFILSDGLDAGLYRELQIEYDIAAYAGVEQQTLDVATKTLIDYMKDDREDIVLITDSGGGELFNAREKSHMKDVKDLFGLGMTMRPVLAATLILMAVFLLASSKDSMRKYFLKSCAVAMGCLAGVWIITAVLAAIDFAGFWTVFHKVFFRNDLWILNPSTDFLIRMMPQRFFVGMVTHMVMGFFITYGAVLAVCILGHVVANKGKGKVSG